MEVMQCHQQADQNQKIPNNPVSVLDLMPEQKNGWKPIASNIAFQRARQYDREYICFWRKKNRVLAALDKHTNTPYHHTKRRG